MELEFSRQIFQKHWDIRFHENPPSEAELFHAETQSEINRYDENDNRFSQLCERA